MTLLNPKNVFKKENAYFFLHFFLICFLLVVYEPADPVYTDLSVVVHRISGYVSTESDLTLVQKGSVMSSVTLWFLFGSKKNVKIYLRQQQQ